MTNFKGWKQLEKTHKHSDYTCSLKTTILLTLGVIAILIMSSEEFATLIIKLF